MFGSFSRGRLDPSSSCRWLSALRILATLLIFTDMSAAMLGSSIKAAIWRVDPALPVTEIKDFEMVLYQQSAWMRFRAVLLGGFAVSGLLLAVIGVWAVVAFSVMRRRREIGIRVALGRGRIKVLGLMLRQVMAPVALGAVAGLVGTFNLSQFLQRWLFDVQPNDPGVLSAVVICWSWPRCWPRPFRPGARHKSIRP